MFLLRLLVILHHHHPVPPLLPPLLPWSLFKTFFALLILFSKSIIRLVSFIVLLVIAPFLDMKMCCCIRKEKIITRQPFAIGRLNNNSNKWQLGLLLLLLHHLARPFRTVISRTFLIHPCLMCWLSLLVSDYRPCFFLLFILRRFVLTSSLLLCLLLVILTFIIQKWFLHLFLTCHSWQLFFFEESVYVVRFVLNAKFCFGFKLLIENRRTSTASTWSQEKRPCNENPPI